jgi:hypothetical protein
MPRDHRGSLNFDGERRARNRFARLLRYLDDATERHALVSDALRQQLGVPPQAAQARQLRAYQAQK